MFLFFVFLILFWPMAYTYLGSYGLFLYTIVTFFPLIYIIVFKKNICFNKISKLPLFYSLYLLIIFLVGIIVFGNLSLETCRYILLPVSFVSGVTSWKYLANKSSNIKKLIFCLGIYIVLSFLSWYLIYIDVPNISRIFTFYAAGNAFTESYINRVRFFGFAGQPAISSYLLSYVWFGIFFSNIYLKMIDNKSKFKFPIIYFLFLLISMASTFSRSPFGLFLISGVLAYFLNYFFYSFRNIKFSKKLNIRYIILLFMSCSILTFITPAFLSFSRYQSLSNVNTLNIRLATYNTIIENLFSSFRDLFFGFFLNSEAMIEQNIRLYVSDSTYGFIISSTGLVGLLIYLFIFVSISYILLYKKNFTNSSRNFRLNFLAINWLLFYILISCIVDPPLLDAKCLFFIGLSISSAYEINKKILKDNFINNQN